MSDRRLLADPRSSLLVILAVSIAVLGGALLFQYVGGLAPCVLCVYQRYPYAIAILVSVAALVAGRPSWHVAGLLLCAIALTVNGGIAVFHVGVEQHWWQGTAACTGSAGGPAGSLDALRQQVLGSAPARCDRVPWALFGVSLAGYNVPISLGLALVAIRGVIGKAKLGSRSAAR